MAGQCYYRFMSAVLQSRARQLLPSRFAWLMGLHGENCHRLKRLFAVHRLEPGCYVSRVDDGLDVLVEVREVHPYTVDLVIRYVHSDPDKVQSEPSAQLRLYLDASVAEVQHCHPGKQLWHVLGPWPAPAVMSRHRMRMATFLNRWLIYLAEQGHSLGTLERVHSHASAR